MKDFRKVYVQVEGLAAVGWNCSGVVGAIDEITITIVEVESNVGGGGTGVLEIDLGLAVGTDDEGG